MSGAIRVLKLGGRALAAPGADAAFARALARHPGRTVVVHGGGAEVSAWSERLGLAPRFENGLRVTDAATLEVTAAVLAGLANKRLVASLRAVGVDAVGLAALDGGTLDVRPHRDAAVLGEVGEVAGADPSLAQALLAAGRTPVFASLAAHQGALLNVNADDAACALAAALGAERLVLLSDTPGLKLGGALVRALNAAALAEAITSPDVSGGMLPKLLAAQSALRHGVASVQLAAWEGDDTLDRLLGANPPGTRIALEPSEVPHHA